MSPGRYLYLSLALLTAFTGIAVSCAEPSETEGFVRADEKGPDGCYSFIIDLSDSLALNSIWLYSVIDATREDFEGMPAEIPLEIALTSPSGKMYGEKVVIDKGGFIDKGMFSWQYKVLYRSGFRPVEYGEWKFDVFVSGENLFPGLRGIGVRHKKEK